ncbi:MAG: enoyl-CoA hydratase/isomerase family protein [Xanthobacteraceae bacterium]|nr:enoyl-CoA hydratase/isomerase family protein [Xanthobacteraceae bacterium]
MFEFEALGWGVHANPQRPDEKTIGCITLRRPEALNAIDVQMRVELDILLDQIHRDDSLRVIIITGEGRGFSAGGDLRTEEGPPGATEGEHDFGRRQDIARKPWAASAAKLAGKVIAKSADSIGLFVPAGGIAARRASSRDSRRWRALGAGNAGRVG